MASDLSMAEVARSSEAARRERGRARKAELLAELLRSASEEEKRIVLPFLTGNLRQGRIGLGPAAARDCQREPAQAASLSLLEVDAAFAHIGGVVGKGSKAAKLAAFGELLERSTEEEQSFLKGLIVGELRQGAQEGVLMEAIARGAAVEATAVRRATMLGGDLAAVGVAAFERGSEGLAAFRLEVGRPVQPMLADSAPEPSAAFEKLGGGEVAVEWKLDGARVQVHRQGDEVRVFTRQLHEVTARVPEVVELVQSLELPSIVLDGEVLGMDAEGRPLPFQQTMRRFGRQKDVDELRRSLPLSVFFFDVLAHDGEEWLERATSERRELMERLLPKASLVPHVRCNDPEEAEALFDLAIAGGYEGLMFKDLAATYQAGRRGSHWIKVKPAHTLDLVVVGVEYGSGRRSGWLSNLHLAARDGDQFVTVSKTFKGMSDEVLAWQTEALAALETGRLEYGLLVRPELVVEIAFDGVLESSQYSGGVALRFARLVRYRPDKGPGDANTLDDVRAFLG